MISEKIEKYRNKDKNNPKYLFHGSPHKLDKLVPRQSHDSSNEEINIDNAVFMFPIPEKASAYSFKDTIKKRSEGLNWDFYIPNDDNDEIIMYMKNVDIDEDITGYIYVIEMSPDYVKDPNTSLQYKSHKEIIPIDVIEVKYKDFAKYYQVDNKQKKKR